MQTTNLWEATLSSFALKMEAADFSETYYPAKTYNTIQKTVVSAVISGNLKWSFFAF
jgi:hypothetical protein